MVLKLQIPEDALRSNTLGSSKCRASKVKVLSALEIKPAEPFYGYFTPYRRKYMVDAVSDTEIFHSLTRESFTYRIGEEYEVDDFDTEQLHECAPGIHFFMNMDEAARYGWF